MSGFDNISYWIRRRFGPHRLASLLAGVLLITFMGAAPSGAETGAVPPDHPDRSVSTSPADRTRAGSAGAQPASALSTNDPPLTRAAAQLHIDEMSPTRWLSGYGSVSIGHRD